MLFNRLSWPNVFYSVFGLIITVVILNFGVKKLKREWYALHHFQETHCTIIDKKILEQRFAGKNQILYAISLYVTYTVNHQTYIEWRSPSFIPSYDNVIPKKMKLNEYTAGAQYPCRYNPDNPKEVILERSFFKIFLVLGVALGIAGVIIYEIILVIGAKFKCSVD